MQIDLGRPDITAVTNRLEIFVVDTTDPDPHPIYPAHAPEHIEVSLSAPPVRAVFHLRPAKIAWTGNIIGPKRLQCHLQYLMIQ